MDSPEKLTADEQLRRIGLLARAAVRRYDLPAGCSVTAINHSENTTYCVESPSSGEKWALRVHRENYHSRQGIASELAWMAALRVEAGVSTPVPVPGRDNALIQTVEAGGVRRPRHCVLFEWMAGHEPEQTELLGPFRRLGEVSAKMHGHSRTWPLPDRFERLTWDYDTTLGNCPHWGRWQNGLGLNPERLALLERLSAAISGRLKAFGKAPQRFGLIHADIRLANLLVDGDRTRVIDFDDCGFGWYLYDCATALSFIEDRPDVPELIAAWLEGYRKFLPLSGEEESEILTFVMLRRLLLVAWIGSHSETDLAKEMSVRFTDGTCDLAERYLASFG